MARPAGVVRRFEEFAERVLKDAPADLAHLIDSLPDADLVRLIAGMNSRNDHDRYRKNLLASALLDRVHAKEALLHAALDPATDLQALSEGVQRALRADMSCIDEVVGDHLILHGRNRLHPSVATIEGCHQAEMALCKAVIDQRGTLVLPDIPADPHYADVPAYRELGLRSYAGAPAFGPDGAVDCVVWVASYAPRDYREDEVALLERAALRARDQVRALFSPPPTPATHLVPGAPSQRL